MKISRRAGATSQILQIFISDSSSVTGAGLTGLVFNSGSLTAYYHRDTDTTATAISLVTMTTGTFTSSGFKEIDSTNMPGWYQFCPPNAAFASGASSVGLHLKGATNMAPLPIEVDLDTQVDVYLWNGTAVASPATAGIPDVNAKNINNVATTSVTTINANQGTTQPLNFTGTGASALVKSDMTDIAGSAVSTSSAQIGVNVVNIGGSASTGAAGYVGIDWGHINAQASIVSLGSTTVGAVTTVTNQLTAAAIATGVWQDTTAGDFTTASSIGKSLYTSGVIPGASGGLFIAGTNAATSVTTAFTTTFTGNLTGSVASVSGNVGGNVGGNVNGSVGSVVSGVTVSTNNDKTGYSLSVAPPTSTQIATAVWTDTTGSDFTTTSSPGKILVAQLGGAFTSTSSSVYSTASLANAPTGGSAPTTAQIATAVWTDLLASSDFSTVASVGALVKANTITSVSGSVGSVTGSVGSVSGSVGGNVTGFVGSVAGSVTGSVGSVLSGVTVTTNNDKTGYSLTVSPPTAAVIATAVWTDTTSSDFTTVSSPGNVLVTQLGGAFTSTSSSVYSTASLVNAPTGGSAPTTAQIATAVWTDTTSSDFTTAGSPGKFLISQLSGAFVGTSSVYTTASLVNAPGGTGSDPWATNLPGSYTGSEAGYILGIQSRIPIVGTVQSGATTTSLTINVTSGTAPVTINVLTGRGCLFQPGTSPNGQLVGAYPVITSSTAVNSGNITIGIAAVPVAPVAGDVVEII